MLYAKKYEKEKENGKVYTIEKNTRDNKCKQNSYDVSSNVILGYGIPMY